MQIRQGNMTPKAAQKILSNNTHNRSVRLRKVDAYARDMTAGKWHNNGETIKIALDGTLIDGQHRLLAVIKSGVTIPIVVVSDLPMEVQSTIDTGAKRNFPDQLALDGVKYSSTTAAICRRMVMLDYNQFYLGGTLQPTETEMREFLENNHLEVAHAAEVASRIYLNFAGGIPARSISGFMYLVCARINTAQADEFFEGLATGENLPAGSPVGALRRKYQRMVAEGGPQAHNEVQAYLTTAWNLYRKGTSITKLVAPKGGWIGNFPTPK